MNLTKKDRERLNAETEMEERAIAGLQEHLLGAAAAQRRERIATAALQGYLSRQPESFCPDRGSDYAKAAVDAADALIAELDRKEGV